jgi:hypothetical protein
MILLFTVAVVLFLPGRCFAEVMDKEPSLAAIWTTALALAIMGYGLSRYRIWAGAARQKPPALRGVAVRMVALWSAVFVGLYAMEGNFMLTRHGFLIFAFTMLPGTILGGVLIWLRWRRERLVPR